MVFWMKIWFHHPCPAHYCTYNIILQSCGECHHEIKEFHHTSEDCWNARDTWEYYNIARHVTCMWLLFIICWCRGMAFVMLYWCFNMRTFSICMFIFHLNDSVNCAYSQQSMDESHFCESTSKVQVTALHYHHVRNKIIVETWSSSTLQVTTVQSSPFPEYQWITVKFAYTKAPQIHPLAVIIYSLSTDVQ